MAHKCPHCGDAVERGHGRGAQVSAGLVGVLVYSAFGPLHCARCGVLKRSDFPPEVRSKILLGSLGMVAAAVAVIGVVLVFLANQ